MAVKELEIKPFSKKGYKSFRFEDIAFSISERVEPQQTNLEVYVGLEHIDADSIHIKRHGTPADVEGTKLKVYPGDLIFGKRRAYQRKAAIANFEGICSAHALVLRANSKAIIPELLPFFIHSDQFMNRAIDISVGSLSPTINWGTLKTQEFVLPPLEQQAKLAELLWAGDNVIDAKKILLLKLNRILEVKQATYFAKPKQSMRLNEIAEILMGQSPEGAAINENNIGTPFLQGNAEFGKISPNNIKFTSQVTRLCKEGDILISVRAPVGEINFADKVYCIGRGLAAMRLKKGDNLFLKYLLNSNKSELDKQSTGSTFKAINKDNLNNLLIPKLNYNEIKEITIHLTSIEQRIYKQEEDIEFLKQIQKQLINQIFGN